MASGRMIRAQISLSEQVNEMSLKSTLLFSWLIPHVDDFGRILANPKRLKALIFPLRDDINVDDIKECLIEMCDQKLVVLYTIEDKLCLQLTNFDEHQGGLHKRTKSKVPPPEAANLLDSGKFREIPGNSGKFPLNRIEGNRIELNKEFPEGNSMSGKPDVAPLKSQNLGIKNQAIEVLEFLNLKTGRVFRPVDTNLKLIIARLKSGATVAQCRQVIAKKRRDWIEDEKMSSYLRPATLFNATKFEQYLGELIPEGEL